MSKKKRAKRENWIERTRVGLRHQRGLTILYIVLRTLVVVTMVMQFFNGNYNNVFTCVLALVLMMIPSFVERRIKVDVPNTLEVIILLFIFSAEILGEIQEYYLMIPHWDTILHTINGFIMAGIGFSMIDLLNQNKKFSIEMSPAFVALVAFCFSMTIGVLWEFFEYGADLLLHTDMQKDTIITSISSVMLNPEGRNVAMTVPIQSVVVNGQVWPGYIDIGLHDTMKDMFVNFVGAVVYSVLGAVYLHGRNKGKFLRRFVLTRMGEESPAGQPEASEKKRSQKE